MRESEDRRARDIALQHFFGLLTWLRTVVVQDAAVLYTQYPNAPIFQYPPFNSRLFRDFASTSTAVIAKAEQDVAMALEKLPQTIANTFKATMARLAIDQELERESSKAYQDEIRERIVLLQELVENGGTSRSTKRRKVAEAGKLSDCYLDFGPPLTCVK